MAEGGALRELLALFEIRVESAELTEASKHIDNFKEKLLAVGKVFLEAFAVDMLKEFVEGQIEAGAQLKVMADRLGLTTDQLQQYQLAAGDAGVSQEAMTTGLRFLNRNISEAISKGGEGAAAFRAMGITLKSADGSTRGAADVLGDLADHISAVPDAAKKTEIAMKLLGRGGAELIPLLNQGGKAFEEAKKQMEALGGGFSEEFVEHAHEAEAAQVRLNFAMKGLKSVIADALIPVFLSITETLTGAVAATRAFFKETYGLTTLLEVLGGVASFKALQGLVGLLKTFGLLKPSVLETAAAFLEFAAPAIIVLGLYLLFDDFYTMMKGGQSVIGETLDGLFGFGTAATVVQELNDEWDRGIALLHDMGDVLGDVATIVVNVLGAAFNGVIGIVGNLGNAISALGQGDFSGAAAAIKASNEGYAKAAADIQNARAAGRDIGRAFGGVGSAGRAQLDKERERDAAGPLRGPGQVDVGHILFGVAPTLNSGRDREPTGVTFGRTQGHVREPAGFAFGAAGHGGNVVHQVINNKIDVHTSSDQPRAVGEAVGQGVATPAERATSNALQAVQKT